MDWISMKQKTFFTRYLENHNTGSDTIKALGGETKRSSRRIASSEIKISTIQEPAITDAWNISWVQVVELGGGDFYVLGSL